MGLAHRFEIEGVAVVAPSGALRLNRRQWAWLEMAMVADSDGDPDGARGLIARLEGELGVTAHDRLTVSGGEIVGEFVSIDIARAKPERQRARKADRQRIRALIADRPVPLTQAQELDLDDAEAQRAIAADAMERKDRRTSSKALNEARLLELRATQSRQRQLARIAEEEAISEVNRTAARRGERLIDEMGAAYVPVHIGGGMVVEKLQRVRRVRNLSRDGLESLLDTAKDPKKRTGITHCQYVGGLRYRELFEEVQADLRSQMGREGAGGGSIFRCATTDRRLKVRDALDKIERRVERHAGHRALTTLQAVAGQARPLTDLATSGSMREALKTALMRALDVVCDHLSIY